jgi:carbamoyltransferase
MRILGLSAYYHDSAAALVEDGVVVAAAQEERFTRIRHDPAFPQQALAYCLAHAGVGLDAVDWVTFYDKPFLKFERLLETYLAFAPRGFASFAAGLPVWIKEKLFLKRELLKALGGHFPEDRLLFSEHHLSHAASAFFPSPFDAAAVLTMDGVGEWTTTSLSIGRGRTLQVIKEIPFPHSLGLLYSAFTYYTGFKVNSGEYKVMGLAPYGAPRYAKLILDHLIDLKPDGSFRLNMTYFDYCTGLRMTNERFHALFGGEPRMPESPLTQRDMDLAASVQAVMEEAVLGLTRAAATETGLPDLCLAGGVALNCVANGRILRDGRFRRLWIQPASGDAGGALGAALATHHLLLQQERRPQPGDGMQGAFLGPEFGQADIESRLAAIGAHFRVLDQKQLVDTCAAALARGEALGWFQGRMEFGPRALGARSILADARSQSMQSVLNLKVKFRESFRPFAPSVLREEAGRWFDLADESPYMTLVADVLATHRLAPDADDQHLFGVDRLKLPRSTIPAVTHVDHSARIQTVHRETNPLYHALLKSFQDTTACPVLVNTSFNIRGEPIVCTPEDAFRCFMGTDIDALAIGNCYLAKTDQDQSLVQDYRKEFSLD